MKQLFEYQERALRQVADAHTRVKSVCCVMPTGAGKTVLGVEWARRMIAGGLEHGLVVAHRIELLRQFRDELANVGIQAGIVSPSEKPEPWHPVQCASLDTLVARGEVPEAQWVIHDECHHGVSRTWRPVLEAQPDAPLLGLTATPQRGDGKALDVFSELVVGAQYSELLKLGRIVPVKTHRPAEYLGSDFARDPVEAWLAHSEGQRGFAFCRSVESAKQMAVEMNARGVRAACVEGAMTDAARAGIVDAFRRGELDCLTNVHILTEGVNIPEAMVCMLASSPQHAGTFMQRGGRVLRAFGDKRYAILIDLPGCSHVDMHGSLVTDREYALEGRAIKAVGESLKNCDNCALTVPSATRVCPECDYEWPRREYVGPKIWNVELVEYFEGGGEIANAPRDLKRREWDRLLGVCRAKGFGVSFAVKEYRKQFESEPVKKWLDELGEDARLDELRRLGEIQRARGMKVGWVSHAYKATFGAFPSRELRSRAGVELPSAEPRVGGERRGWHR